ncbi:MAG: hypothetical protein PHW04_07745 [Candidatus Wallbacteria bacterium]|nr:hypothetical protein [Candidatus Wallbacteria bacterium]
MKSCALLAFFFFAVRLGAMELQGAKAFEFDQSNLEQPWRESLNFVLQNEIPDYSMYLDYDDRNELNSDSLRRISLNYKTEDNAFCLGDQNWEDNGIFGLKLPVMRGVTERYSWMPGREMMFLYSEENRNSAREDFFGQSKRGPYLLKKSPVVMGSERVYLDDRLLISNFEYTLDYDNGMLFFQNVIASFERITVYYRAVDNSERQRFIGTGGRAGQTEFRFYESGKSGTDVDQEHQLTCAEQFLLPADSALNLRYNLGETGDHGGKSGYALNLTNGETAELGYTVNYYSLEQGLKPVSLSPEKRGCDLNLVSRGLVKSELFLRKYGRYDFGEREMPFESRGLKVGRSSMDCEYRQESLGGDLTHFLRTNLYKPESGFNYFSGFLGRNDTLEREYYYVMRDNFNFGPDRLYLEHYSLGGVREEHRSSMVGEKFLADNLSFTGNYAWENQDGLGNLIYDSALFRREKFGRIGAGYLSNARSGCDDGPYLSGNYSLKEFFLNGKYSFNDYHDFFSRMNYGFKRCKLYLGRSTHAGSRTTDAGTGLSFPLFELKTSYSLVETGSVSNLSLMGSCKNTWNWELSWKISDTGNAVDNNMSFRVEYLLF